MIDSIAAQLIVILLLALLGATAITIARMRQLWAAVMLTGVFSFLGAGWMLILDAPDVAFTEAAVGAGISTFLMLATLGLTSREAKPPVTFKPVPLVVVIVTGCALVYGTLDMPHYGDPDGHIHEYPDPSYIVKTNGAKGDPNDADGQINLPNVVTAILASYRGYDTFGETTVILTAGVGVILLLRRERRAAGQPKPPPADADVGGPT
ncbi:MAG: DUF4040 domain-containing protein [Planctomycetota bacterium]|nr:DUF4040 domain-containing protein [Planctomycetota bacterium]